MPDDDSVQLQVLIDRFRQGDRTARHELLERACARLRKLAARLVADSFPVVRARHDLDSVVHETWLRLAQAMETAEPPTVADFFRLAAHKVRQVLLDLAEKQRRLLAREALGLGGSHEGAPPEASQHTHDPARLAAWAEFHQKVEELGEEERAVFEMHHYLELPQAEIARLLDLHPRKVSRLWITATERLAADIPEGGP